MQEVINLINGSFHFMKFISLCAFKQMIDAECAPATLCGQYKP